MLEVINILEPEADDIISDGFEIKLSKKSTRKMLSLSSFGNGISSIVVTISSLVSQDADIVFIDEIEEGVHHLSYPDYCERIVKIAQAKKIQLFITDHSMEFLREFYNKAGRSGEEITLYGFQKNS